VTDVEVAGRALEVVIPTYNNWTQLRNCLSSLVAQDRKDFRVLVCVDGSTDDTLSGLAAVALPVTLRVLTHPDGRNRGRSAARNLALSHLDAPFVLLLDSDMRLRPDGVRAHLELLEGAAAVSVGDVVYTNGRENLWARYQGTRGKNKRRHGDALRPLDFNSQNTALPTDDLIRVGGFDESFVEYGGEDTELAMRIAEVIRRPMVFNRRAVAETVETKSVELGLAQLDRFARVNLPRIVAKHPSGPGMFHIDRLESTRITNRLFRLLLNPVVDRLADALLPRTPFAVQRQLLNYKVIRTVYRAYGEAT